MWRRRAQNRRHAKRTRGAVRITPEPRRVTLHINRRGLLGFAVFAALAYGAWLVSTNWQQSVVPLEQVHIEGRFQHLSPAQLQRSIQPQLLGGYFSIDLEAVRDALLQLPWVQDVSVRRQWPSGLLISVQEKTAVAYWNDDALLSSEGEVFRPAQIDRELSLPALEGPEGMQQSVWQFMNRLYASFAGLNQQVDRLVLDRRHAWQIHLANGTLIRLGRNQAERRLQRFLKVFAMPNAPDLGEAVVVDMRYPNGFAMLGRSASNNTSLYNMEGNTMTHESEV